MTVGADDQGTFRIATWADWFARFDLLLLLISVLSHRFQLIDTPSFFWLLAITGLIAVLALMISVAALRRAWQRGEQGSGRAIRGALVAALILVPFCYAGWLVVQYPALHDISTDLEDPPRLDTLAARRGGDMTPIDRIDAEEAEQQLFAYPEITGRRYAAAPDTVNEALAFLVTARGWDVVNHSQRSEPLPETTIELVAQTPVFGFLADIAIRFTDEGETTYVDMRSASRYGAHDLGDNAKRIAKFLNDLDIEMANRAGG